MRKYISLIDFKSQRILIQLKKISTPFLLLVFCSLGAYLRIIYIHHSLWLDELTTAWVIEGSFSEIFTRCWINNLSPLYYIIIYASKVLFGYSELSLRIPGLIVGILTIPIIYLLTYKLSCSKNLSLLAAFIASIDYSIIFYSLELRPYAFIIFFSLVHLYIFLFFLQRSKNLIYAVVLGVMTVIIILLHYTAASICIVELFIAVYFYTRKNNFLKRNIYGVLTYILIPCVFLLPFLTHIKYLFENNYILGSFVEKEKIETVFLVHTQFIPYILFPLMIGLFFTEFFAKTKKYNIINKSFTLIYFLSWYFISSIFHWLLTEINLASIFLARFLSWTIPATIIGSVILIDIFHSKWVKLAVTITLLFLTTKIYVANSISNNFIRKDIEKSIQLHLTRQSGRFGWKEAVNKINNSGIKVNKIYVKSILVERFMLNTKKHENSLLSNYLLSTVNSMYKLQKEYLEKAEPIISTAEIPDSMSNYIVVGPINQEDIKNGIRISPNHNVDISIFYVL